MTTTLYFTLTLLSLCPFVQAGLSESLGGHSRKQLNGDPARGTFCELDDQSNCHWEAYASTLAVIALPFAILAVLSLLAIPVFLIGRYALNVFGGRRRAPGTWFFGGKRESNRDTKLRTFDQSQKQGTKLVQYPRAEVWIVRLALLLLLLAMIICLIVGLVGNARIHESINGSVGTVSVTLKTLSGMVEDAVVQLKKLPDNTFTTSAGNQILEISRNVSAVGDTVESARRSYEPARNGVTIAVLVIPPALLLLAILAGLLHLPRIIYLAFFLAFLVSALTWFLTAGLVSVGVIAYDGCHIIVPYVNNLRALPSDQVPTSPIAQIVACSNNPNFKNYREIVASAQTKSRDGICELQNNICSSAGQTCGTRPCVSGNYNETLATTVNDPDSLQILSMSECATSCQNTQLRTSTMGLVTAVGYAQLFDETYQKDLLPLLNCSIVDPAIDRILYQTCHNGVNGADILAGVFLAMALIMVFATVTLLAAYKRWRPTVKLPKEGKGKFEQRPPPYNPEANRSI